MCDVPKRGKIKKEGFKMTVELIKKVFDEEGGDSTVYLNENANNVCIQSGFSVESGSVTVKGKISKDDEEHTLGFMDLKTGEILTEAEEGIYSLLGCELLYSVTFSTDEESVVTAKFLF